MKIIRSLLAKLIEICGGGKGLFKVSGIHGATRAQRALVLVPGMIPTTDIYLRNRLSARFQGDVDYIDVMNTSPDKMILEAETLVFIVRHTSTRWLNWLESVRARLNGVVYLLDDDIPAALYAQELPFAYALKTAWRYACIRRKLAGLCSEIWVSTPELAQRYASSSPKVVEPLFLQSSQPNGEPVVYFYHGTWAHRREIEWLVPIVRKVQERCPGAWFEIMGTDKVWSMFRGIPRVRVVHPMTWPDYLFYANAVQYQIGLAPCMDTEFNRARSHVKFFDITRLGAVGVFSNVVPYSDKVIHGKTGVLCENEPEAWVNAIVALIGNRLSRNDLLENARLECGSMTVRPLSCF